MNIYETKKRKRPEGCGTDAGLRFTDDMPVEVIQVVPPELIGNQADQYEVIDTKVSHKLAQCRYMVSLYTPQWL